MPLEFVIEPSASRYAHLPIRKNTTFLDDVVLPIVVGTVIIGISMSKISFMPAVQREFYVFIGKQTGTDI